MRVLFLARWYPEPRRTYDGIFIREHAKAARSAGNDVVVLHAPGEPTGVRWLWRVRRETDPTLTEGITTYRVHCRRVSVPHLGKLSRWISYSIYSWSTVMAFRRLRKIEGRPDLIHAHVWNAGIPAALISRLSGLPFIVTEHASVFLLRSLTRTAVGRARLVLERADRVLPVSADLQRAISDYGINARFEVVPNAVDTSIFYAAPRTPRPGPSRRLMFVGTLEPTAIKGFPTLIRALAGLRERRTDWHLDVVGEGPSRAEYEQSVAESALDGAVTFHGSQTKQAIAAMMRAADLFVLPSRVETQGCVIIEALASGLPVVSTRVGGIPELVTEREGILVAPEDAQALTEALDRVLSDLSSYDGRDIAARAAARYGLAAVGSQLAGIYAEVVAAHGKRVSTDARPVPKE